MHQIRPLPHSSGGNRTLTLRGLPAVLLILLLAFGPGLQSARAASSDEKLLGIARTTVYGALLGGLLGLASTLIVDEDDRGDAVRWGVALGTFGGFAYAIATYGDDDDFDDFSLRHPRSRLPGRDPTWSRVEESRRLGTLGYGRNVQVLDRDRLLSGIEVIHGGLEKESSGEEESGE